MQKLWLMLIITFWIARPALSQQIRICMEAKKAFFVYNAPGTENSSHPGYFIDLIRIIFKKLNKEMKIVRLPWKRCLMDLKNGQVDVIATASFKKKRQEYGVYPMKDGKANSELAFDFSSYYLYSKPDSKVSWDGKKLAADGPIGSLLGYSISDDLRTMGASVQEVTKMEYNLKKLKNGRIKAFATHQSVGDLLLRKHGLVRIEPPLKSKPYYLLLSHQLYNNNRSFANKFWKVSSELARSEEARKIIIKYLNLGSFDK